MGCWNILVSTFVGEFCIDSSKFSYEKKRRNVPKFESRSMAKEHSYDFSNTKNVSKTIWNLETELVTDCRSFWVHAFTYKKFMSQILNFVRRLLLLVKFHRFSQIFVPYCSVDEMYDFCFRNRKLDPFSFVCYCVQIHNWLVYLWNWYQMHHHLQYTTQGF